MRTIILAVLLLASATAAEGETSPERLNAQIMILEARLSDTQALLKRQEAAVSERDMQIAKGELNTARQAAEREALAEKLQTVMTTLEQTRARHTEQRSLANARSAILRTLAKDPEASRDWGAHAQDHADLERPNQDYLEGIEKLKALAMTLGVAWSGKSAP
ncbi:MAG: hypothetical protein H0W72_05205 [Planctomycetes bacterium]|nr:hypothetical protein [Planctomycetota bacterium]